MDESIFKLDNGEVKLYQFEKWYITLVLRERIELETSKLNEMEQSDWIKDPLSQAILPTYKRFISELQQVLDRVNATPQY